MWSREFPYRRSCGEGNGNLFVRSNAAIVLWWFYGFADGDAKKKIKPHTSVACEMTEMSLQHAGGFTSLYQESQLFCNGRFSVRTSLAIAFATEIVNMRLLQIRGKPDYVRHKGVGRPRWGVPDKRGTRTAPNESVKQEILCASSKR